MTDVEKVTEREVKRASKCLNDGKSDPMFAYSSECFKYAPDVLHNLLAIIIRAFLIHGHVTYYLLLATLVPIVKNKLASISTSKNYRSIAVSSLILKLIDLIILDLFGYKLGLDDLQFAYQNGASTTMCTWAVIETISYFLRNGAEVFTCQTDMSKAFDMIKHSLLFNKLLNRGFSRIFTRLLIFIYRFQFANVRWNSTVSNIFSLCNGVRQGAVLSRILYCLYSNNLFQILRRKTTGCWVNNCFHGIFGYSDDKWVLAPSISGLQEMLRTIEEYCDSHNVKFSTDSMPEKCKTKCIAFLFKNRPLPNIVLYGNNLPWVSEGVHLGNYFDNSFNMMHKDIKMKRASFIAKNYELIQEFYFAHPISKLKVSLIYNCHFTGSPIWDLFSQEAIKLENSWNVFIRKIFDLPMTTHRYFIELISQQLHLKKMLINRFLSFTKQIKKSSKNVVKQLFNLVHRDAGSITGRNIRAIKILTKQSDFTNVTKSNVKGIIYAEAPVDADVVSDMIKELTDCKFGCLDIGNLSSEECNDIINFLCTA